MRRVMLFALLALGLPTAVFAKSIDFDTGKFERGTLSGTFATNIKVTEVGSMNTITLDTGTLTKLPMSDCSKGFTCYDFTGGSITVKHDGTTLFTDSLASGMVKTRGDSADITATLMADAMVKDGTVVSTLMWNNPHPRRRFDPDPHRDGDGDRHEHHARFDHILDKGSTDVTIAGSTVPEPGTLGLLGTGLIGLAGIARRKLKL